MGNAVSVIANILAVGTNWSYALCDPATTKAIECGKATPKGEWWFEPYLCADGICYRKWSTAAEAGDAAIRAVEVLMDDGQTFYLNGTLAEYTDDCNECCGSTPVLTPIAIPAYIPCTDLCADSDGNYVFSTLIETLYSGQTYTVKFYADNALIGTSGALASPAAVLAYAQANWSAQGTWALDGNVLTLTSTDVLCANFVVTLVSHSFCLTVDYPFTFDQVRRSGNNGAAVIYTLPVAKTVANEAELDAALSAPIDYFADGTVTHATAGKVQYAGTGRPITLLNDDVVVGTWTTAACS